MLAGQQTRAGKHVTDRFVSGWDKLMTYSGWKTCRGRDSTIKICHDSVSRFVTGSLCFWLPMLNT